jgi:TctA family transporter
LQFSFAEIGAIGIFGVAMVGALSRGAMIKGIASGAFGMLLSTVGLSVFTGEARYTFGQLEFQEGLPLIATVVGLFALPEMADLLMTRQTVSSADATFGTREVFRGARIALKYWRLIIRHSLLGVFLGAIPGIGARVVSWLSYGIGISMTKNRRQFGRGSYRGLVFSEAVQSAKEGGHAIPTLALGVPAGQAWVFVLVAMIAYGVSPGPQFLSQHTDIVVLIVVSLVLGNAMLATIGMLWSGRLAKLSRLPYPMLCAVIVPLAILSAFQETRHWTAVPIVLTFAGLGFVMKYFRWPRPPLVLGFILGGILERYMFISIERYGISWLIPQSLDWRQWHFVVMIMFAMAIMSLMGPLLQDIRTRGGVRSMLSDFGRPVFTSDNLFNAGLLCLFLVMLYQSLGWSFEARIIPTIVGTGAVLFCSLSLATDIFKRPLEAGGLADKAKAVVSEKIHMDIASKTAHLPGSVILIRGFLFFGWMAGFLCSMALIGLIPTVPIFIIAYMRLEGREKYRHAIIMAAVMVTLIYIVFDQLLSIPWPPTVLGDWFPALKSIPSV